MPVKITYDAPLATAATVPEFPLVQLDCAGSVYQEALVDGRYLGVPPSAMGRPLPRQWTWERLQGGAASDRPLRRRQHAFSFEVDGSLLVEGWEWIGASVNDERAIVSLRHPLRKVKVAVETQLDGTELFARRLEITNIGEQPCALSHVAPWSGLIWEVGNRRWDDIELGSLPSSPFSVGRMTDSSAGTEGSFDWLALAPGGHQFESMHGRSGWGVPFCLVRNEATGEILVLDFGWSGNWSIELFNDFEAARILSPRDARVYARAVLAGPSPVRVLAPGEGATTPFVHVGALFGGLDDAVLALHRHIRGSVVPKQPAGRRHRVEVNHTAFTRNEQMTDDQLYAEIDLAAEIGAELFMVDAGWFGASSARWFDAVGDWDHESPLLTKGLKAAFDHVHAKGLLGGLWVEAERMGRESQLYADHPDWAMTRAGETILNLDLSRPEVRQHLERTLVRLIERYELDCFRLDFNHNIGEGGERERFGHLENVLWRYYDGLYEIFEHLHERYPDLLLENCSSGGGRMDLGMMARFHWTQITDRWSPGPNLKILNGATLALPPELCESVVGGISEGVSDVAFLVHSCLFGHFNVSGVTPTVAEANQAALSKWQRGIQLYKDFCRPVLDSCRLYHHTPIQRQTEAGDWVVLECASEDRNRVYAGVFRLMAAAEDAYQLIPRGVDPSKRYRVTYDSTGLSREVGGGDLIDNGLRVAVPSPLRSELLLFEGQ
jgi:alpha-galactosidase